MDRRRGRNKLAGAIADFKRVNLTPPQNITFMKIQLFCLMIGCTLTTLSVQGQRGANWILGINVSPSPGNSEDQPGDYEFDLPAKLIDLEEKGDYGRYGEDGKMPVCFIGTNHTTGGNSGSPAIDAHGNLIGLNFDRVWEGTMSDINYDARICRNIMVDIRYVLFIIDKFADAGHLVKEMKLVHPKNPLPVPSKKPDPDEIRRKVILKQKKSSND